MKVRMISGDYPSTPLRLGSKRGIKTKKPLRRAAFVYFSAFVEGALLRKNSQKRQISFTLCSLSISHLNSKSRFEVGRTFAGCKMAICRARLTRYVMRAARLHFIVATAKFPAMHSVFLRMQVLRGLRQARDPSKRVQRHEQASSET